MVIEELILSKFLQYQSDLNLGESMLCDLPSVKDIPFPLDLFEEVDIEPHLLGPGTANVSDLSTFLAVCPFLSW